MAGSGKPSRTLSRVSVLRPMRTASPNERWRSRWRLSSREVKSTGVKFRVVILPSTVMAKVAARKGRGGGRLRLSVRRASLGFGDFMLQRRHFFPHLFHFHVAGLAARFVEKINEPARAEQ